MKTFKNKEDARRIVRAQEQRLQAAGVIPKTKPKQTANAKPPRFEDHWARQMARGSMFGMAPRLRAGIMTSPLHLAAVMSRMGVGSLPELMLRGGQA